MAERRKAKRAPEPPAVAAARKNRKFMADIRRSIADIVAGNPDIPGKTALDEAGQRDQRIQP